MYTSHAVSPKTLLDAMAPMAHQRFGNDARWAAACGLPRETLSRMRSRKSCDLSTISALAAAAGFTLAPAASGDSGLPGSFGREEEERLLELCASGSTHPAVWRAHGAAFFMSGVAAMLGSVQGFDRRRYLHLAEQLHTGMSVPEVFALWLRQSPLRPARFLPMLARRKK